MGRAAWQVADRIAKPHEVELEWCFRRVSKVGGTDWSHRLGVQATQLREQLDARQLQRTATEIAQDCRCAAELSLANEHTHPERERLPLLVRELRRGLWGAPWALCVAGRSARLVDQAAEVVEERCPFARLDQLEAPTLIERDAPAAALAWQTPGACQQEKREEVDELGDALVVAVAVEEVEDTRVEARCSPCPSATKPPQRREIGHQSRRLDLAHGPLVHQLERPLSDREHKAASWDTCPPASCPRLARQTPVKASRCPLPAPYRRNGLLPDLPQQLLHCL